MLLESAGDFSPWNQAHYRHTQTLAFHGNHWPGTLSANCRRRKEKGAPTKAAPETPTKGRIEQHLADAPVTGRSSKHCFDARVFRLRLVVFLEAET